MSITGPSEAREDDSVTLRCSAEDANLAPELRWTVNGASVDRGVHASIRPEGAKGRGWHATSDLRLEIKPSDSQLAVTCLAVNKDHDGQTMTMQADTTVIVLSKHGLQLTY